MRLAIIRALGLEEPLLRLLHALNRLFQRWYRDGWRIRRKW